MHKNAMRPERRLRRQIDALQRMRPYTERGGRPRDFERGALEAAIQRSEAATAEAWNNRNPTGRRYNNDR